MQRGLHSDYIVFSWNEKNWIDIWIDILHKYCILTTDIPEQLGNN